MKASQNPESAGIPLPDKKSAEKRQKKRQKWPPIRSMNRRGRIVFVVDGRMQTAAGRTGTRFFFDTKGEAETKADQLRIKRTNEGKSGVSIPERLRIEAMECAEKLAAVGATLSIATDFYLTTAKPTGGVRTCAAATAELLAEKRRKGKRESYVKALGWSLGKFNLTFGERSLTEVTRAAVEEWFAGLNVKPATESGYIRDVNILFNFGVDRGYCALNPAAKVEKPMSEDEAPEIFTVQQASQLLKAAETLSDLEMTASIAIGLFAGLRTSELRQLDWSEIDFEGKVIEVKGRKSKTRQRRLVDMSDNLRKWLLPQRRHAAFAGAGSRDLSDSAIRA